MSIPAPASPGFIVALLAEGRLLTGRTVAPAPSPGPVAGALLRVTGMGTEAASAGAAELLAGGATGLVIFGFAAGLAPEMGPGDVVIGNEILGDEGRWHCDEGWSEHLQRLAGQPARRGAVLTVGRPLLSPEAKARQYAESDALAADMESAAVAAQAAKAGVPCAVLRVVLDPVDVRVPACALATDRLGRLRLGPFLARLIATPADWAALGAMVVHYRAAARRLATIGEALRGDAAPWP